MAGIYAIGGILALVLIVVVGAYFKGRKAGAVTEQAKVATKTVEVQKDMAVAEAKGPHTQDETQDRLNSGTF